MIGTMIFVLHQIFDWANNRNKTDNYNEISTLEVMDASKFDHGATESMIVFSNCDKPFTGSFVWDDNNNKYPPQFFKGQAPNKGLAKMNLIGAPPAGVTPESDCNSNNLADEGSFCSSHSMDFVQDNSDYQWFLEYGYRDQGALHRSVLSLTSSHEVGYYDELARNLDANLAEVEMEDFQSKDIHSILSTLHHDMQGMEEREMFASVSGSLMVKFDFDSSVSPHSSTQEANTSITACKSEPLFSPLRQTYLPAANLSVDSLDLSDDMNILVTCQANKNNYTIAFEGSTVMGSDSDFLDNAPDQTINSNGDTRRDNTMARSDSMYTTWSQLKQQSRGSDNGNTETDTGKSISMPDLCKQPKIQSMAMSMSSKLSSETGSSDQSRSDPRTVKLYDIRKSAMSESSSSNGDKGSRPRNFSLVKLFMKQKGGSSDGMEQSSASECWGDKSESRPSSGCGGSEDGSSLQRNFKPPRGSESADAILDHVQKKSNAPIITPTRNVNNNNSFVAGIDKACQTDGKSPVYVVYPNYTMPSLDFIKDNHQVANVDFSRILLRGQKFTPPTKRRPVSANDIDSLRKKGLEHVQDWASLTFLLPKECKEFLEGIPEMVTNLKEVKKPLYNLTNASSGYRGSSTMINSNLSEETQPRGILRDSAKFNCKTAKDTANMRRLEELMEISTVFGDSDSVTESEMHKLRSQVSRFLSMQKELERVSEKLSAKEVCLDSSDCLRKTVSFVARGATPPNSPIATHAQKQYLAGAKRLVEVPICEESDIFSDPSLQNLAGCLTLKKDLVQDVQRSVEKVIRHAGKGDVDQIAQICLQHLCPSLYAVLSDGLRESIATPFGPIPNSVWAVVEASAQQGPMTRALHELVQKLNREFVLTEPLLKVNAFFFGLLNVDALDGWLSYLRTQEGLLHKYYESRGLFVLANAVGSVRGVVDKLVDVVRPLAKTSFTLDLLYQAKILHRSLSNINSLLEATSSDGLLSPSKQLMLLKLVQSIQNSGREEGEGPSSRDKESSRPERRPSRPSRPRPRSGCELPSGRDVASAMKKRWSGVQLNSKLSKAFEQLGEELESEYTDSLDGPRKSSANKRLQFSDDTSEDVSTTWAKESTSGADAPIRDHKKIILSSLNKKGAPEHGNGGGGQKFKRLQQRWEQLSGRTDSSVSPLSSPEHKPRESERTECCDISPMVGTPSPTTRHSRIPRLVTSPVRPSTAPFSVCSPQPITVTRRPQTSVASTQKPLRTNMHAGRPTTAIHRGSSAPRPTSLPYRGSTLPSRKQPPTSSAKSSSMSLNRRTTGPGHPPSKLVRTLTHRLPSDSGHLSFNEGEKLRVVLEVDDTYLLCCSGTQKGLVPKSAVIAIP